MYNAILLMIKGGKPDPKFEHKVLSSNIFPFFSVYKFSRSHVDFPIPHKTITLKIFHKNFFYLVKNWLYIGELLIIFRLMLRDH